MLRRVTNDMLLKKKKYPTFLWRIPLIFSYSNIKVWQAVLALLSLPLPCPARLISESFWFTVETGPANCAGRSCQTFSSLTRCDRRYQRAQEITLHRLPGLSLIYTVANVSCCFAYRVHIFSLNVFELSVCEHPFMDISCCVSCGWTQERDYAFHSKTK